MRGRNNNNNNRRGPNPLTRSYESNGPDVKIRGTAHHIAEKYLQLARDAQTSGDPVMAESYLQHAEHYFRLIAAAQLQQQQAQGGMAPGSEADDSDDDEDFSILPDRFASPHERLAPPQPQANGYHGAGGQAVPERAGSMQERNDAAPRPDYARQEQPRADQPRQDRPDYARQPNGQRFDNRGDNRPDNRSDNRGDNRNPRPERGFYLDRQNQNQNQNQNGQRRPRDFRYDQPRPDQPRQDLPRSEQPRIEGAKFDAPRPEGRRENAVAPAMPERDFPESTAAAALPAFITAPTRPVVETPAPVAAERHADAAPEATAEDKPRRRRRTKAEMEADAARNASDAGLVD
ncbi:MAG: DUF4167 domain-containing protein [Hyphomicrobiales bacterium]|nr:DUF4167 domain-containing protein [Hyphomicrobiales bacterium]